MANKRVPSILAAFILTWFSYGAVAQVPPDTIDRSAPRPPPAKKYVVSANDLRNAGIAFGAMESFPNECYGNVSVSNELLNGFRSRGFSRQALCLAITSPWVTFNPETGRPLPVSKNFLFTVPDCFKNGTPFLDCKFIYDHTSGLKLTNAAREETRARAIAVDAAVRRVIASGRYATPCACEDMQLDRGRIRTSSGDYCSLEVAPPCLGQLSRGHYRAGSLVTEIDGYSFENVPTKGLTDYGDFDISPRLPRGYAYRIGSPEGDDETPYVRWPDETSINVGTE